MIRSATAKLLATERVALPLSVVRRSLQASERSVQRVGTSELVSFGDVEIPLVRVREVLGVGGREENMHHRGTEDTERGNTEKRMLGRSADAGAGADAVAGAGAEAGAENVGVATFPVLWVDTPVGPVGLAFDAIAGKGDVIVKSVGGVLKHLPFVSGAAPLGETAVLVLDAYALSRAGRSV